MAKAILLLAEGQKQLSDNQAALGQMIAQQTTLLAQAAQNSQWVRQQVEAYVQPATSVVPGAVPLEQGGDGGRGGGFSGVNLQQITTILNLLRGPQLANPLDQLTALGNTLQQVHALTAPFQEEYSRGARDTADAILKANRMGIAPDAIAQSILETQDRAAARLPQAGANEPPKT